MIHELSGDLFAAQVEALVNPVNTQGVMGAGLALGFRRRYPDMFAAYQQRCRSGDLLPGVMHVWDTGGQPRWVINFPTKVAWREPSQLSWIEDGLVDLVAQIGLRSIRSVALPALGCGLGGLAWQTVKPVITQALAEVPDTEFYLFSRP